MLDQLCILRLNAKTTSCVLTTSVCATIQQLEVAAPLLSGQEETETQKTPFCQVGSSLAEYRYTRDLCFDSAVDIYNAPSGARPCTNDLSRLLGLPLESTKATYGTRSHLSD